MRRRCGREKGTQRAECTQFIKLRRRAERVCAGARRRRRERLSASLSRRAVNNSASLLLYPTLSLPSAISHWNIWRNGSLTMYLCINISVFLSPSLFRKKEMQRTQKMQSNRIKRGGACLLVHLILKNQLIISDKITKSISRYIIHILIARKWNGGEHRSVLQGLIDSTDSNCRLIGLVVKVGVMMGGRWKITFSGLIRAFSGFFGPGNPLKAYFSHWPSYSHESEP